MKRLILLRHAKAERRAASGADRDRALSDEGRRDAARVGHALAAAGLIPDVALVSTAARTRETFDAVAAMLPDARLETDPSLYEASAETLRRAAEAAQADTVLLIAHNPGVGTLATSLARSCTMISVEARAALEAGFPTATAAAFEFADGRTGCLGVFGPDESAA